MTMQIERHVHDDAAEDGASDGKKPRKKHPRIQAVRRLHSIGAFPSRVW